MLGKLYIQDLLTKKSNFELDMLKVRNKTGGPTLYVLKTLHAAGMRRRQVQNQNLTIKKPQKMSRF